MGGDRHQLPAAARRARRAPGPRHGVADAGAGRPARGAPGVARALPGVHARRSGPRATGSTSRRIPRWPSSSSARRCATPRRPTTSSSAAATWSPASRRTCAGRSAATHAVLPLLATDAGVRLQLRTGIASHRARFGSWGGGLWLPECAHAPWLDPLLEEAGARIACVDLTDLGVDPRRPLRTPAGPVLAPIDREVVDLVWGAGGYPSGARVPEHARAHDASPPRVVGRREAVRRRARAARRSARTRPTSPSACASGSRTAAGSSARWTPSCSATGGRRASFWLAEALDACEAAGVPVVPLDDAVEDAVPLDRELPVTTWGQPRTLETWSGPARRRARVAPARGRAAGPGAPATPRGTARCASCWRCSHPTGRSWPRTTPPGPYPLERAAGHERALAAALAARDGDPRRARPRAVAAARRRCASRDGNGPSGRPLDCAAAISPSSRLACPAGNGGPNGAFWLQGRIAAVRWRSAGLARARQLTP